MTEERFAGLILVEDDLEITILSRVCGRKKQPVRRSRVKGCSGPAPSQYVCMLSMCACKSSCGRRCACMRDSNRHGGFAVHDAIR